MEELMSCLVLSSPPRLISPDLVPEHTPTTQPECLFFGPHSFVAWNEQTCIYYDSLHSAGICLGTNNARTHVHLELACQRSMISAQRKLRLTMQHVYGHGGNLGNECADHAAALLCFLLSVFPFWVLASSNK